MPSYRCVPIGTDLDDAVTVGIEQRPDGALAAAVWWPSKGDVDADEAEYGSVEEAFAAAEAARALHGFGEVAVTLQSDELWNPQWGSIATGKEPFGRIGALPLSDDEAYELAAGIEENRDA
jgi:hypothetical protein